MIIKTYSELITYSSFLSRFEYLSLCGTVGLGTFGFDRVFNQMFYHSPEWKKIRRDVIIRDNACDLGISGYDIPDGVPILIHHLNPIDINDISECSKFLLNPEYLISTTFNTHRAIHYGDKSILISEPIERMPNDTCPWKI